MPANPPNIPNRDVDLFNWAHNFAAVLTAAPTDYGLVSGDAVIVNAAVDPWETAYALATTPATRTPVSITDKDTAKATMLTVVRPYAIGIAGNPAVTNPDKVSIGVTVRVTTRTRIGMGTIPATLALEAASVENLLIRTTNPDTPATKAQPYGSRGVQVECVVRNAADTADEFTSVTIASKALYQMPVAEEWRGRNYRIRSRWVGAQLALQAPNYGIWSNNIAGLFQ